MITVELNEQGCLDIRHQNEHFEGWALNDTTDAILKFLEESKTDLVIFDRKAAQAVFEWVASLRERA
jgi:hypothetical protein